MSRTRERTAPPPVGGLLTGGAVVVTGAGSGIGRACALACAGEGASVVVGDIDEALGRATAESIEHLGGRARHLQGDVAESATHEALAEICSRDFGKISGWINNAAFSGGALLGATGDEDWQKIQAVTLGGVFHGCRSAIARMTRSGGGAIVNISSSAGLAAEPGLAAYGAAKAGVFSLTRSAAVEYAGQGVRVNAISPGPIDTPALSAWLEAFPGGRPAFEAQIPQGRLGQPEEIAQSAVFLLSDRSSFINGAALVADGGIHARLASPRP
jgi:NAD(P)-dependent dehydrogenase (short-subunit alcohol dehydrogenase family)